MIRCEFYDKQVGVEKREPNLLEIRSAWRCLHPRHSPSTKFTSVDGCVTYGGRLDRCPLLAELFSDV